MRISFAVFSGDYKSSEQKSVDNLQAWESTGKTRKVEWAKWEAMNTNYHEILYDSRSHGKARAQWEESSYWLHLVVLTQYKMPLLQTDRMFLLSFVDLWSVFEFHLTGRGDVYCKVPRAGLYFILWWDFTLLVWQHLLVSLSLEIQVYVVPQEALAARDTSWTSMR